MRLRRRWLGLCWWELLGFEVNIDIQPDGSLVVTDEFTFDGETQTYVPNFNAADPAVVAATLAITQAIDTFIANRSDGVPAQVVTPRGAFNTTISRGVITLLETGPVAARTYYYIALAEMNRRREKVFTTANAGQAAVRKNAVFTAVRAAIAGAG